MMNAPSANLVGKLISKYHNTHKTVRSLLRGLPRLKKNVSRFLRLVHYCSFALAFFFNYLGQLLKRCPS